MNKVKILIVLPSLKAGGAEKVMSFIAKKLDKTVFHPKLVIIGFEKDTAYDTNGIETVFLNKKRLANSIFKIISVIRKEKPNIVLSSIVHVNVLTAGLSVFFKKTRFIAREASVMSIMHSFKRNNYFLQFFQKRMYPMFDKIICQSYDMLDDLHINYGTPSNKLEVINNPITDTFKDEWFKEKKNSDIVRFITVGRLSEEKGHLRLLEMLTTIKEYEFKYTIVGDGPLKEELKKKVADLGLKHRVNFIDFTKKVSFELLKNDVFIQGSYVEGFPNAVLESCSIGVPVLAFNVPGGTKEIVKDGVSGYLFDSQLCFEDFLKNRINDVTFLESEKIREYIYKKFNGEYIVGKYESLFMELLN